MPRWSEDRFTALLTPHMDRLYRLAYRLTGSRADAEDLLQDALTRLFQRHEELNSIRELAPYASRVLYNQFIDHARRYGRQPLRLVDAATELEQLAADAKGPEADVDEARRLAGLEKAVAKLSEDHRIVLLLSDAEGYTLPELETLLDVPVGTLKSRLHRARARLRELLKSDGTFFNDSSCSSSEGARSDAM